GVEVLYKRAYVTKAQEAKRKKLTWKDFADEMDYSGLLNAIRNSKASKMTLIVRAFINGTRVNLAYDIAVYSHGRKNTEFAVILKVYWIWNNATFGSPSMCSFSRTRIDTRFIE